MWKVKLLCPSFPRYHLHETPAFCNLQIGIVCIIERIIIRISCIIHIGRCGMDIFA